MKFRDGNFLTSERLSPHKELTPEGYLLCRDVPISRVGTFDYTGADVSMNAPVVHVGRPAEELFKPETIASFEGKPIVIGHDTFADPETWKKISIGHVQNVRRGEGDESGLLLADLLVLDKKGIDLIENGTLCEISCGYDANFVRDGADSGHQVGIVGNHVALVNQGRCGPVCSIGDGFMNEPKSSWKTMLRRLFRDGDEDKFNEALDKVDVKDADPEPAAEPAPAPAPSPEDRIAALEKAVGELTAFVQKLQSAEAAKEKPEQAADEEPAQPEPDPEAAPVDETVPAEESQEVLADAEDVCPGIKKTAADAKTGGFSKDVLNRLRRQALKAAGVKEFGDADTLDDASLAIAFKAAAELARAKNNPVAVHMADQAPRSTSNADLNKKFAEFWKEK